MKRILFGLISLIFIGVGVSFLFGTTEKEEVNKDVLIAHEYQNAVTIEDYEDFLDNHYYTRDEQTQYYVANTMLKLALAFADKNNIEAELKTYNQLVQRFIKTNNNQIKQSVVQALLNKAKREREQNNPTLALSTYTEAIKTFKHSRNTEVCSLVLEAEREKDHLRQELARNN